MVLIPAGVILEDERNVRFREPLSSERGSLYYTISLEAYNSLLANFTISKNGGLQYAHKNS